jgi:HAE1 family hydrophobic/amphiphilic exporter-1
VAAQAEVLAAQVPGVQAVYSTVGVDARADAKADEGAHTARIRVQLVPSRDLEAAETAAMEALRSMLERFMPEVGIKMARPALFSTRTPIEVVIIGWDLAELREAGDAVAQRLSAMQGLRDVHSSLAAGHPEIQIQYDRMRLHRLGLDAATVAAKVRDKVQGVEATRIHQGDQRISLMVQLLERDRNTLDDLKQVNVNPSLVPVIPLDAVADIVEAIGPSEIRRVDQQRAVVVSANLAGFDLGSAVSDIEASLRGMDLSPTVHWTVAGQSAEMQQSLSSLRFALGLAIFLVYVIMASTFENVIHPLVILFSVPLAVVGAVFGLGLSGSPVSVVVLIGLIVLAGVVVNNAIVLVDTINGIRAEGMARDAAIRKAAGMRLRPILITTATTVLGLMPLALGFGAGAEMQGPLAVTVIGGLLSSTLLTLVVIPIVYRVMNREDTPAEASGADEVVA